MRRLVRINDSVIEGSDMLLLTEILPQLKNSFTQRKEFFEYYFQETWVDLTLESLEELSKGFYVLLSEFEILIQL